jgi:hypothetical protein
MRKRMEGEKGRREGRRKKWVGKGMAAGRQTFRGGRRGEKV